MIKAKKLQSLKNEAISNPQKAMSSLFIISGIDDLNINHISVHLGIKGKLDYSIYLKHQLMNNIQRNYLNYAKIELGQLQRLAMINSHYVKIDSHGYPHEISSIDIIEILNIIQNS